MSAITVESIVSVLSEVESTIRTRYTRKLSVLRGRYEIYDLIQDVAIKACQSFGSCRAGSNDVELRYWVLQIARNTCETAITSHRGTAKRSIGREQVAIGGSTDTSRDGYQPSVDADPAMAVEIKEECARMIEALKGLTAKQAQAVRMSYLEGAEYTVIAETMEISVNAARLLVSQGIKAARALVR